jgi:hypothetical protein
MEYASFSTLVDIYIIGQVIWIIAFAYIVWRLILYDMPHKFQSIWNGKNLLLQLKVE